MTAYLEHIIKPIWPAPNNVKSIQSTRQGGFSSEPFSSMNLAAHLHDDPLAVSQNRNLLQSFLPSEPIWLNQVHGVEIIEASKTQELQNADGSFTMDKNIVCVSMTADCLPVLFCDKGGTVVSSVHAGWRGLCDGVLESAVNKMSVDPLKIMAWLGPAIGPKAFEVGDEVREQFLQKDQQSSLAFKSVGDKWLCDIYLIAKQRLNKLGVKEIYGASINEDFCTYTDQTRFFSFRRDNVTGRMASLIWLSA